MELRSLISWNQTKGAKSDIGAQIEKGAFLSIKRIGQIKEIGFELFLEKSFRGSGSLRSITVLALELYQTGITQSCHPNLQIKSKILCLYKNLGNQRTICIKIKIGIFWYFFGWVNHWEILFYLLEMIIVVFQ